MKFPEGNVWYRTVIYELRAQQLLNSDVKVLQSFPLQLLLLFFLKMSFVSRLPLISAQIKV